MSFKKQQPYQPDMFKVPQLPARLEKQLYDPLASHNQFYKHVFCKIPEDIFSPLSCAYNGRPNASPRLLCAMCAFKAIPKAKRWLRNNVEAAMFQLTFHTRNNKTRYRGLMKQKIFAISCCLWVNCVRLSLFELRISK